LADRGDVEALRAAVPDLKESLEIGREGEAGCPNLWADDAEGKQFKEVMLAFFETCKNLHMELMRAIAVGLGIDSSWFDGYTDRGDNTLRLLHYPPVKKEVFDKNKEQVRAGAHSDYGSITLLFQDSRGGLQVQSPNGNFIDATPIEGTIVINAGDLLARWSNDTIKSTTHRVVEPPHPPSEGASGEYPARYSVAYFCNPNFDRMIEVIPSTCREGEKPRYDAVNSGEYLVRRLTATY
jgi:isopenicillin N synthase-like dioxygenase